MTIVPDIVVAERISASKKTGNVPKIAIAAIDALPKVMSFTMPKSIASNFEKDENVESKVEAAEVIIIKLITSNIITPKALPTSTAAWPLKP